jgi:hypothetical protein
MVIGFFEILERVDGERRGPFRKIAVDACEQVDQVPPFGFGKPHVGLGAHFGRKVEDTREDRARLIGQHEAASTAVPGIRPALDPAVAPRSSA